MTDPLVGTAVSLLLVEKLREISGLEEIQFNCFRPDRDVKPTARCASLLLVPPDRRSLFQLVRNARSQKDNLWLSAVTAGQAMLKNASNLTESSVWLQIDPRLRWGLRAIGFSTNLAIFDSLSEEELQKFEKKSESELVDDPVGYQPGRSCRNDQKTLCSPDRILWSRSFLLKSNWVYSPAMTAAPSSNDLLLCRSTKSPTTNPC